MKMTARSPTAVVRLLDSVWDLISFLNERERLQLMLILTLTQLWTLPECPEALSKAAVGTGSRESEVRVNPFAWKKKFNGSGTCMW